MIGFLDCWWDFEASIRANVFVREWRVATWSSNPGIEKPGRVRVGSQKYSASDERLSRAPSERSGPNDFVFFLSLWMCDRSLQDTQ